MDLNIEILSIIKNNHKSFNHLNCDLVDEGRTDWIEDENMRFLNMFEALELKETCYNYCIGFCESNEFTKALEYIPNPHEISTFLGLVRKDLSFEESGHVLVGIKNTNLNFLLLVDII